MAAPVTAADCAPFGAGNKCYTQPHATPGYCPPGTPSAPPTEPPMAPGEKPMTDPMADPMGDQPQTPDQPQAQQPQQQPQLAQPTFNPSAPTTASSSPSSIAPNMIGDFFGAGGGGQIVVPYTQFSFPGNPATPLSPIGPNVRFDVSTGYGPVTLTSVDPVSTINANPDVDMVGNQFALQENASVTGAVQSLSGLPLVFIHSDATLVANDTLTPGVSVFDAYNLDASYGLIVDLPNPSAGGSVGRQKIGENTSPMPRDRVFFNYSYFDNTNLGGGANVHRYTPGFEKTFLNGDMSFELRTPFASTVGSDVIAGGAVNDDEVEFGNLTMYLKALLVETQTMALSAGLGVAVPTASDASVKLPSGQRIVGVENNAVHLLPFVGGLYTPTERLFAQGFLQLDVDANGNAVYADVSGSGLQKIGVAQDQTFLFLDLAVGYWVYLNPNSSGCLRGLAPTLEVHYNAALESADVVRSGGLQVGRDAGDVQLVNGVVGMTALLGHGSTLTAGYAMPLGGGNDQQFDGELRVMLNVFFGGTRDRLRRVQF